MTDPFDVAVERAEQFQKELALADPVTAKQLLAAWKETIIEQFLEAIQGTDDPKQLACLDHNSGLVLAVSGYKRELALHELPRAQRAAADRGSMPSPAPRV